MKIAQIVCVYPPYKGGIGTAAQGAYNTLKEKHQVTNFSFGKELNDEVKYLEPLLKFGNGAFIPKLYRELKAKSKDNIYWKLNISRNETRDLFSNARAFLFPPEEDF